jgi:ribokinase
MIGCVGDDDFGVRLRNTLAEGKVDCSHLEVSREAGTGVAVITVTDAGENTIVLAMGANALVDEKTIERASDVFKKADAALFQLEIPVVAVAAGLAFARKTGCKTVLTPAPATDLPRSIWPMVDYLVLNETELVFYASKTEGMGGGGNNKGNDAADAAKRLVKAGAKGVIVTRGALGGVVVTKDKTFTYAPFKVDAVDSTGAGDAFCAGMIMGLSEGMPFEQAARFASASGALACTRFGAHPSLPWRHEVEALLERDAGTDQP